MLLIAISISYTQEQLLKLYVNSDNNNNKIKKTSGKTNK